MNLTNDKASFIEKKMKEFKLVDMREQYQTLISEAEETSESYLDFLIKLLSVEDEGKTVRRTEKLTHRACFEMPSSLEDIA